MLHDFAWFASLCFSVSAAQYLNASDDNWNHKQIQQDPPWAAVYMN